MKRKVKIGLIQLSPELANPLINVNRSLIMIENLAKQGANFILFPEFAFTGYHPAKIGKQMVRQSLSYFQAISKALSKCARKNHLVILAGMGYPEECGKVSNAVCIYDETGHLAGVYRKNFSFANEREYFAMGHQLPIFKTTLAKIGVLICYDIGFPETARKLTLQGAEIIFIAAAWQKEDEFSWELNVQSRALENQVFVAAVNQSARISDLHLFGRSMICSPDGLKIIQLDYDREMAALAEIDLAQIQTVKKKIKYIEDLKNSFLLEKFPGDRV